jgi:fatty-acyl-CoA synthase
VTPDAATLRDLLVDRAATDPDGLAFDDGARRVGYRELARRAAGQARRLDDFGVSAGDRVLLAMSAGVSFAEAFWACQLLGAATCAVSPHLPVAMVERRAAQIRARLVVGDGTLADAPPERTLPPEPPTGPDDLAFLQLTSGTSGDSRAAMIRHRTVLAYLRADDETWAAPGDVFVGWAPPWHDMGLVRFVIGGVAHGVACHIVEPAVKTIPQFLATIERVGGTHTAAPDFAYRLAPRMFDPSTVDISSLRSAGNGGEPVRRSSVERFEEAFGLSGVVQPGYGLAEATLGVTMHPAGEPLVVDERESVALGRPRSGIEIRADGDASQPGEILLRGEAIFDGYFDAPEDTEAALRDGWLYTGDVGYVDEEGRLYVLGRRPAMIKRAGAVVAPRELEEVAEDVEGVAIAAAVGVPDAAGLTDTAVVAVEHPAAGSASAEAVASAVARAVTRAVGFSPAEVVVVPRRTIPRTTSGKVRHAHLRELLLDGVIESAAAAGARG